MAAIRAVAVPPEDPAAARLAATIDCWSALVQLLGEHPQDATGATDIGELVTPAPAFG